MWKTYITIYKSCQTFVRAKFSPKSEAGEFYTVYFDDCIIDGETVDAVGLFKSENKDTFLKVFPSGNDFDVDSEQGINTIS